MSRTLADSALITRRTALLGAAAALLPILATAQDQETEGGDGGDNIEIAEVPSYGARRPGPVKSLSSRRRSGNRPKGLTPVVLSIPDATVDAPIEVGQVIDGIPQNPTGPWVITWYSNVSAPGLNTNVVMSGHVDYWDTGPAVLWNLPATPIGAPVYVTMADGQTFTYAIESSILYALADLTPEILQSPAIFGDTDKEALTLITCGGAFDPVAQAYLERWVVRANLV